MDKNIKKINARTITLTILFVLILVVIALLIGKFSYSYLAPTVSDDVEGSGEVTASGDTIIFTKGNTLSLSATTDNFKTNGGNLTATTNPKVKLMASSKTNSASSKYFAGIIIKNNTYSYTTTDKKPEVILTVKDENGNIVESSADNLTFVTVNDNLKGFDITGVNGAFNIVTDHVIATSGNKSEVIHTWIFTLTFVNLVTDQTGNENSTLNIDVVLQKDKIPTTIADFCSNGDNLGNCIVNYYNGLNTASNIYYHDLNLTNGAEDNSYRFAGADPNNYVCFGSDETTCPNENLYRIIGVIDGKVKLIHAYGATTDMLGTNEGYTKTYQEAYGRNSSYYKGNGDLTKIGSYKWNKTSDNTWSTSTTNTINLNTNYLTYLDSKNTKWKTMIDDTKWYVGGMSWSNLKLSNAETAYNYEVGANKDATTTVNAKIGLMYASEYYYAATSDYWTLPRFNLSGNDCRVAKNDNWLYTGLYEWALSRNSDFSTGAFIVHVNGFVGAYGVGNQDGYAVRPSFSLSSSIKFTSGEGTAVNPIRIKL